jgi:glycine/D-amino acid oxidase-like deaminating enzyme
MPGITDAEIVIVGGGAVGCAAAYSLAQAGKSDLLVLERAPRLGTATTSQGAGLVGQVRSSPERTRLAMRSVAAFNLLEKEPRFRPGWRAVGSLRIAETEERVEEFLRLKEISAEAGLEAEIIERGQAARLWPSFDFTAARAVLWCPSDGYLDPGSLVRAYEESCRKRGVRFALSTALEGIIIKNGRVEGVATNQGRIGCRLLINAAGAHAYHVAKLAGIDLPIVPVRHEYFVTVPVPGLHPGLPCFRFPDATLYGRACGEGLLLGGWEARSLSADPREYPLSGDPPAIEPDQAVLGNFADRLQRFLPGVVGAGRSRVGKGWPTFTPDGRFIIGESSRVKGFVMAGGCNAHGISGSAGIGSLLCEALLAPQPSTYAKSLTPDRFTETGWDWETASRDARSVYERYYAIESC